MTITSALLCCLLAQHAHAGFTHYSMPVGACTPDPQNGASKASVDSGYGSVAFASGQTGTIKLTCPVVGLFPSNASPTLLNLAFYDEDTTTDNCYVAAYLQRRNTTNPDAGPTLIQSYDSVADTSLNGHPYRNWESKQFSHTFDFDQYFYWVQIILSRNTTSCNVDFTGWTLSSTIP